MSESKIKEISSQQAWEILEDDPQAVLLDVRTCMEYEYVGHPINAMHIPWMDAPDWNIDAGFVDKVRDALLKRSEPDKNPESIVILAICRSGKRSKAAAEELANHGFNHLYNIEDGFEGDMDNNKHRNTVNGWRAADLPWEQS